MKTIIVKIAFVTSFAIASLITVGSASAQSQRHQTASRSHQQFQSRSVSMPTSTWDGGYDRASSPNAGGP